MELVASCPPTKEMNENLAVSILCFSENCYKQKLVCFLDLPVAGGDRLDMIVASLGHASINIHSVNCGQIKEVSK